MPELEFQVVGVEAVARGLVPLLHFRVEVGCAEPSESIAGLLLQAQIQLQPAQRRYTPAEQARLVELFGTPERWGQTLRNRLWTHANTTSSSFTGRTEVILPVACSYDLNLAASKYFFALESGEVSLLFLFSGSLFYTTAEGRLQVQRISWNKESVFRLSAGLWQQLMQEHFPNSAWLYVRRELFERLEAFKRSSGLVSWDEAMERLLAGQEVAA